MSCLKAVILEGLRRHPPTHVLAPHSVTHNVIFDGYVVPKNKMVNFMVADMGWDPEVWEEPMEFKSERFLNKGEGEGFDITGSREIKMMPFGVQENQYALLEQEVIDGAANDLIVEIADRVINETSDQSLVDSVIVGIVSHATPSVSSPQQIRLRKDTHEDIVAPTRSANDDNVSTNNSFEILAQVQQESLVGLHSNTLVDNEDSALGEHPVKRVCWGDLENEEPLGHTHYVSSTEINYETWYHENETTSDERLLCALPKPQHKKVKAKQYQSSSRYPARNRTPPVRLDL
ncbi:hypothetical protein ACLB2K_075749 [Fragaria x ananassa]